jgi:hypothetical protein
MIKVKAHDNRLDRIAVSSDGRTILSAGGKKKSIKLWELTA